MTKIWLTGSKGMLGHELSELLKQSNIPFVQTDRDVDITDIRAARDFFERQKPVDWVINCAAYTAVDAAEDDADMCRAINVEGPANLASLCSEFGARLIHISTDYVFDGKGIVAPNGKRPYREDDAPSPTGVYGKTKLDGELAAQKNCALLYIVRTAWLYGQHGKNFAATMLKAMNERDEVKVVNDQWGSPTWARDLAAAIMALVETTSSKEQIPFGVYHYTNEGAITWFDFAKEIYVLGRELGLVQKDCKVTPCSTAEYPAKAPRPAYSVLDKSKIKGLPGIKIPAWNISLKEYLNSL